MLDVTWEGVDDDEFVTREKELNEGRRRERGGWGDAYREMRELTMPWLWDCSCKIDLF